MLLEMHRQLICTYFFTQRYNTRRYIWKSQSTTTWACLNKKLYLYLVKSSLTYLINYNIIYKQTTSVYLPTFEVYFLRCLPALLFSIS